MARLTEQLSFRSDQFFKGLKCLTNENNSFSTSSGIVMKQAELRNSGRLIVTGAGIRDLYSAKGGGLKIVRSCLITLNEQDDIRTICGP